MTTALILWAFYAGFALSISVYRLWIKGTLNLLNKLCFAPVLITFALIDVLLNYTVLRLAFGPTPPKCYTISARFEYYHKVSAPSQFAKIVATFTCEQLLNTIDPSGDHC
jgi:hypothetical protein